MYDENGAPNTVYYYNNSTSATKYYYVLNLQGDVTEIRSESNALVAQYNYDAFGNILSIKSASGANITSSTHIANVNPLRYRGYFYDTETGFYYLNSRYYDPATRRFISADSVIDERNFDGLNLYAYCGNNPVMRVDTDGRFWDFIQSAISETGRVMQSMSPAYAGCGGAAAIDGPVPFGDIAGLIGAAVLTVGAIGVGIYEASKAQTKVSVDAKEEEKEKEITAPLPDDTVIYRYGKGNLGNFVPKQKDIDSGLSFSLIPPPLLKPAFVTTIGELNATGMVIAKHDKPLHVSVVPAPHMGTLQDWIDAGTSHPCTIAVRSVCRRFTG